MNAQTDLHARAGKIKCLVWDLDNTLWRGVLAENDTPVLHQGVVEIIQTLDRRGILQSIASKNDHHHAMAQLERLGLAEYFLHPQINWNPKSEGIANIAERLNIGIDSLAFIDDQPFEREEVRFSHPEVLCLDATLCPRLLELPALQPRFLTPDSANRRRMYLSDIQRQRIEADFSGPKDAFLATLDMVFAIAPAREADLQRAEELTLRTNQLNTTGYTYSYEELQGFCDSPQHHLLVSSLDDRHGTYGKIGLTLVERDPGLWTIKLLLMSCRVMSRGVGNIMIHYLRQQARRHGVRLCAEMIPNERNRMMYMTYKFAHFHEIGEQDGVVLMENDLASEPVFPDHVRLQAADLAVT